MGKTSSKTEYFLLAMGDKPHPYILSQYFSYKQIAAENNVPIHEDVQLARALYKVCNIGDEIPENLYKAVAQILAYIFQMKKTKKRKSIV